VLGLSRKHLRLFEYSHGECRDLELPAGVPASLEAAGGFDQPDHDLQNRSAAGFSAGAMAGVQFGTLSDREAAGEYRNHFFGLVDRGLKPILAARPLLLMGVREEIVAYRRVAKCGEILSPEISGNTDFLTLSGIAARAADAAQMHYDLLAERAFAEYREMPERRRTLDDVRQALQAAAAGRVHQLFVRAGAEVIGPMEPALDSVYADGEDLVNAAVMETLRTGGDIFVLPEEKLPATSPVAAVLRY
jgi:hypothetical protein